MSLETQINPISVEERDQVGRNILIWLNSFPRLPEDIAGGWIQYENLDAKETSMAMSTVQGTYITDFDIVGHREAEYQFKVIYRIRPGGKMGRRLEADELLDELGSWASGQTPYIGEGKQVTNVVQATRSALFAAYENGDEDHQIFLNLTYQINA